MLKPVKFILAPVGSAGDLHPLVALGKLLTERGHEVVVVAQAFVADIPQRARLRTLVVGDQQEQEKIIREPQLWHPRKGFNLIAKYIPASVHEMLPCILDEIVMGETVILGGALAFAARIAAERRDVPLFTVQLQPSVFMSADDTPVLMARGEWLPRSPRWVRKSFLSLVHFMVDHKLRKVIGTLRHDAGVPGPMPRGVMKSWWNSPDGVLCMFPEWFAPKAADWPPQAVLTRFPLYDEAADRPPNPQLEAFLAEDSPPVVITPGSANVQAAAFLREALTACVQNNRRAVLITRDPEQVPGLKEGLPSMIAYFPYLPFSEIFPRAAAVIHHGGIGTTAQCFAAGVPQLIMPMSHDQPDNANRVKKLGAGDYLYPRHFRAPAVGEKLNALLASNDVHVACAQLRQKMRRQMTSLQLAELIETMAELALRIRAVNGPGVPA